MGLYVNQNPCLPNSTKVGVKKILFSVSIFCSFCNFVYTMIFKISNKFQQIEIIQLYVGCMLYHAKYSHGIQSSLLDKLLFSPQPQTPNVIHFKLYYSYAFYKQEVDDVDY